MNIRFSLLDLDINTNLNTYGLFLGNWMTIDKAGKVASEDRSVLRVEYSVITGWELEVFGVVLI